jgi:flagellar protein FliS
MTQTEIGKKYREAEIRGASSVDCTIMLYDIVIINVRKAIECLQKNDIEGRTDALVYSMKVLEQLQLNLQMESGGEAAKHLYRLYSLARAKILEAQLKSRAKLLEEILDAMLRVRGMWEDVRRKCVPDVMGGPWTVASEEVASGGMWRA